MSKKIIIIRHAKSSWSDFNISDFDRPLDERGLRDAPIMANLLKETGHHPQKLISSAANRAQSTAKYFSKVFDLPIEITKELYHGEPGNYIDQLMDLDNTVHCVALFGHNPGITHIANLIQRGSTDNVPTCGIIIAETIDDTTWQKISWKNMRLINILTPKNPHP